MSYWNISYIGDKLRSAISALWNFALFCDFFARFDSELEVIFVSLIMTLAKGIGLSEGFRQTRQQAGLLQSQHFDMMGKKAKSHYCISHKIAEAESLNSVATLTDHHAIELPFCIEKTAQKTLTVFSTQHFLGGALNNKKKQRLLLLFL